LAISNIIFTLVIVSKRLSFMKIMYQTKTKKAFE